MTFEAMMRLSRVCPRAVDLVRRPEEPDGFPCCLDRDLGGMKGLYFIVLFQYLFAFPKLFALGEIVTSAPPLPQFVASIDQITCAGIKETSYTI
jgi:hypothetical protein